MFWWSNYVIVLHTVLLAFRFINIWCKKIRSQLTNFVAADSAYYLIQYKFVRGLLAHVTGHYAQVTGPGLPHSHSVWSTNFSCSIPNVSQLNFLSNTYQDMSQTIFTLSFTKYFWKSHLPSKLLIHDSNPHSRGFSLTLVHFVWQNFNDRWLAVSSHVVNLLPQLLWKQALVTGINAVS